MALDKLALILIKLLIKNHWDRKHNDEYTKTIILMVLTIFYYDILIVLHVVTNCVNKDIQTMSEQHEDMSCIDTQDFFRHMCGLKLYTPVFIKQAS